MPDKANYRRFQIRTVSGADDFAMMYEVLSRRYRKRERLPDLIIVDGGKGQLGVAQAVMRDMKIEGVELIGLAKERDEADRTAKNGVGNPGRSEDRVFLPGRKAPVYLSRWPAAFFLLQRIRDEAHRFAITYHRKLRQKGELRSLLDKIPGIGQVRKKALLLFFGDLKRIREASVADLMRVEGIGEKAASRIRAALDDEGVPYSGQRQ